jgi:uncharacterized RmlC-like cupin family protein
MKPCMAGNPPTTGQGQAVVTATGVPHLQSNVQSNERSTGVPHVQSNEHDVPAAVQLVRSGYITCEEA